MILKPEIKERILNDGKLSLALAACLGFTQTWIRELAHANKDNGPLTTVAAVAVLKQDAGTFDDSEVLEKENHGQAEPAT